ncbi:MAG: ABC transporter ATP-binding protein [Rikenellaceae bacterium]
MIEATNIKTGYILTAGKQKIVSENLNFTIHSGALTAMLGANGSGKSTLIKTLCGFIPPLAGNVLLNGKPINKYTKNSLAKAVGVVLTDRPSDGGLTVYDLVSLGRYPYTGYFGTLSKVDHEIVEDAIEKLGLTHLKSSFISRISDGERQKVMIAKIIAQQCQTIILDEPTAFLDVKSRLETYSLLHKIAHDYDKTVLLSTHDLEITLRHADRLLIISSDKTLKSGTTEDLIMAGDIKTLFTDSKSSNITFNQVDGAFRIKPNYKFRVFVEGEEKYLFWLRNALIRNSIEPCNDTSAEINITIETPTKIIVNKTNVYSSVDALISDLSKMQ